MSSDLLGGLVVAGAILLVGLFVLAVIADRRRR